MSCLLTMCLGKLFMPKTQVFENNEENEDTPSLYDDIRDTVVFKLKVAKQSRNLKAEMKTRELERQKRREKINKIAIAK